MAGDLVSAPEVCQSVDWSPLRASPPTLEGGVLLIGVGNGARSCHRAGLTALRGDD